MQRVVAIVILSVFVAGCGQTSFVGKRVDNFTAYYNKFFNARKAFDAGLKAIEKENVRVERDRYIALFTNPDVVTSNNSFRDAIKKSADVLREHPNSKWVDDALLLIGKSYFYQQNYVGAEQKFLEVIGLKTRMEDEARFWLARTLIVSGAFDRALQHLVESLNREGISSRWVPMLRLAQGELHVERGEWEAAEEELSAGLRSVRDRDLGARAQFLLGQVYETMGAHDRAVVAYADVERFRPLYELTYAAQLSAIRVKGMYVNEGEALRELRRMERDGKNYANRNELAYIRGRIFQANGRADDAFLTYDHVLYGSDGDVTRVRGPIHYSLGRLYRDYYRDFLTAAAHFDTAATTMSSSAAPRTGGAGAANTANPTRRAATVRHAPEAISDAKLQQEMFRSFSDVKLRIDEMDSLLYLGSLDEEEFEEAILQIRRRLAAEMEAMRREMERREAAQAFSDAGAAEASRMAQAADAAQSSSEAGFLFHRDPMLIEENWRSFVGIWGERQLVPNWRRRDAVHAYLAAMDGSDEDAATRAEAGVAYGQMSLPIVDVSRIPREESSRSSMLEQRAEASYELANVLFLGMDRPDSAAVWYRMVVRDANDSTLIQRAYYALAEVHRAQGDVNSANELYRAVLEMTPSSELGRRLGRRMGIASDTELQSDTLAQAEEAYERAYGRWRRGSYRAALQDMIEVAYAYPTTSVAPRALMAAGSIYTEWATRDSLELFGPLPVSLPDSVLDHLGLRGQPQSMQGELEEVIYDTEEPVIAEADQAPEETEIIVPGRRGRSASPDVPVDAVLTNEPLSEQANAEDSMQDPVPADSVDVGEPGEGITLVQAEGTPPEVLDGQDPGDESLEPPVGGDDGASRPDQSRDVTLEVLYASVQARYAESPFSDRARRISAALRERRIEIEGASWAAQSADSARGLPSSTRLDSLEAPVDAVDEPLQDDPTLVGPAGPIQEKEGTLSSEQLIDDVPLNDDAPLNDGWTPPVDDIAPYEDAPDDFEDEPYLDEDGWTPDWEEMTPEELERAPGDEDAWQDAPSVDDRT